MAAPSVTPDMIQAALVGAQIVQSQQGPVTSQHYVDGKTAAPGRFRWVQTNSGDTAAVQAAAILSGLRA